MAEEKPKSGRPLGATGETVRRNIRWIREARGTSGAELSEALKRLKREIPVLGIQRIEAGTRRVDVDDLAAIAVALDVSPASLLMPLRNDADTRGKRAVPDPGDEVQADDLIPITGWSQPITASAVWRWLIAARPLVAGTEQSFIANGLPAWERERITDDIKAAWERSRDELLYRSDDGND